MTDPQALVRQFPWITPDRSKKPPYDPPKWKDNPRIDAGRTSIPIVGSDAFRLRIEGLLGELREHLPHRYREVLDYLPQIAHHPWMLAETAGANAAGWFKTDGANDLDWLRNTLYHETGHNVEHVYTGKTGEPGAIAYAEYVEWELNQAKARKAERERQEAERQRAASLLLTPTPPPDPPKPQEPSRSPVMTFSRPTRVGGTIPRSGPDFPWISPQPWMRPAGGHPPFAGRTTLPIIGPEEFTKEVEGILNWLKQGAPWRWQELVEHLPKAEYAPQYRGQFGGRGDGLFTFTNRLSWAVAGDKSLRRTMFRAVAYWIELFWTGAISEQGMAAYAATVSEEYDAGGAAILKSAPWPPTFNWRQEEWNRLVAEYGEEHVAAYRPPAVYRPGTLRLLVEARFWVQQQPDPPKPPEPPKPPDPPGPKEYRDVAYPATIGTLFSQGKLVEAVVIPGDSRRQGTYIIGKNGTGKSNLIEQLILQDAERDCRVVALDPHGELVDQVLGRLSPSALKRATIFDFGDATLAPSLNLYFCPDPDDPLAVAHTAKRSVEVFKKIWGDSSWGPRMEDLLRMIGHTMAVNYGTLAEVPALLTNPAYREGLLERVKDDLILTYWRYEYADSIIGPVMNKVRTFLTDPLLRHVLGRRWAWRWSEMLERPGVTLIKLPLGRLGESAVSLLGTTIVGGVLGAAFGRERIPPAQRLPVFLYADEFQRFSTPDFGSLLQEARKYRVGTVLAHQLRSQLDQGARSAVLGAANLIAFGVTGEDATELSRELSVNTLETAEERRADIIETLTRLPRYRARAKIALSDKNRECVIQTTAPVLPRHDRPTLARRLDGQVADLQELEEEFAGDLAALGDLPVLRKLAPPEPKQPGKAKAPKDPGLGAGEPEVNPRVKRREEL